MESDNEGYAPTNEADETIKDDFYNKLDSVVRRKHSNKDIIILIGDFNAKVGNNNNGYEQIMGMHGLEL